MNLDELFAAAKRVGELCYRETPPEIEETLSYNAWEEVTRGPEYYRALMRAVGPDLRTPATNRYTIDHFFVLPKHCSGSDYSGTLDEVSNYEYLWENYPGLCFRISGDHGTFGIGVPLLVISQGIQGYEGDSASCPRALWEDLESLDGYPLLDESLHSELEQKAQEEAWDDWGWMEFRDEVIKRFPLLEGTFANYEHAACEAEDPTTNEFFVKQREAVCELLTPLFYEAMCDSDENWVNEQSDSMHINMEKVAAAVTPEMIIEHLSPKETEVPA